MNLGNAHPLQSSLFSLVNGLTVPVPPTPWDCLEDQPRAHTEGLGLEKSPVQIIGLGGLFLPPVTASSLGEGLGPTLGDILERVKQCPWWPSGVMSI